jgi:hypothetical protein
MTTRAMSTIARLRMQRMYAVVEARSDELVARQAVAKAVAAAREAGCDDVEIQAAIRMIERASR